MVVRYCARDGHAARSIDEQVRKLYRGRGPAALESGCVAGRDAVAGARTDRRGMGDTRESKPVKVYGDDKAEATTKSKKAI
jgi:hypothetical protein